MNGILVRSIDVYMFFIFGAGVEVYHLFTVGFRVRSTKPLIKQLTRLFDDMTER